MHDPHATRGRPRLLFLRSPAEGLPRFIQAHLDEQLRCLAQFFNVVLAEGDADYDALCDRHRPDLALFESGIYGGGRTIRNVGAHPSVPKLGFLHADAYCVSRSLFLSDMARWQVGTFFTLSLSMAEYLPDLADDLFVWPNFVDPAVCRDYGEAKPIPVLFTGSRASHYPWRHRVHEALAARHPVMTSPHHGWHDARRTAGMVQGEAYARMINAALVAPACGTIANELVRKHFEIPACGTLLLAEPTPALEAAGFRDMENCILADAAAAADKVSEVLADRDRLERMTRAGHDLVHARHTMGQRDQIHQWLQLRAALLPGQRIVQTDPFGPLGLADATSPLRNRHIRASGRDRALLSRAMSALARRDIGEAERCSIAALNYQGDIVEAKLCLALCRLHAGRADQALEMLARSITHLLGGFGAADPDPVEWAWLIAALMCRGDMEAARRRAAQFPHLTHPELDACRAVVSALTGGALAPPAPRGPRRASVHLLPRRDLDGWVEELLEMLHACNQPALAQQLDRARGGEAGTSSQAVLPAPPIGQADVLPLLDRPLPGRLLDAAQANLRRRLRGGGRARRLLRGWVDAARFAGKRRTERAFALLAELGALRHSRKLPFTARVQAADSAFCALRDVAARDGISTVLLITGPQPSPWLDAALQGVARSPAMPVVLRLPLEAAEGEATTPSALREIAGVSGFDLVVLDTDLRGDLDWAEELQEAALIWVGATGRYANHEFLRRLVEDGRHELAMADPVHLGGYALLRRRPVQAARAETAWGMVLLAGGD